MVLHDLGWDSRLFGTMHPADTLIRAMSALQPRLLCLSLSFSANPETLLHAFESVCREATKMGIAVAVGGSAVPTEPLALGGGTYCRSMGELRTLAIGLGKR